MLHVSTRDIAKFSDVVLSVSLCVRKGTCNYPIIIDDSRKVMIAAFFILKRRCIHGSVKKTSAVCQHLCTFQSNLVTEKRSTHTVLCGKTWLQ